MPTWPSIVVSATSLLGAPAALSGCAVGPDFKTPQVAVPDSWQEVDGTHIATRAATDSLWWRSFHDATLNRLVELGYRQNLPLQVAGLRIVQARAQLAVVTGLQYPQTQIAFGSATAIGLSRNAPNFSPITRQYGDYQVGFDAAWELDLWGKYRRGVEAESATVLASMADYYSAIVSLTAEVARTYVAIRTFEVLIELARGNVSLQETALAIAQSRFRNGATSELDPTQAATLLASTRATIPQLQIGLQQARNALTTLLGQPTGTVDTLLGGPKDIPTPPAKVAVGVPAEILRRRPDVQSAELNAAAQCARIGVAKAALYPSFSLVGTIGLETTSGTPFQGHLFSPDSLFYSVGPQVQWPFFNYGRLTNAVRVEDARFEQLLVAYHDTVLRALQEVEDALVGFVDAREAKALQERAVASAQRSVELALVEYQEGAADYQRVLDAQRSLLEEQNSLAQTSSSVVTNLIALYKALGGGWESRQGQPIVPEHVQHEMRERTDWNDTLSHPSAPENDKNPPSGQH